MAETIGYFTIATKGNASDFGSLEFKKTTTGSNGTRGILLATEVAPQELLVPLNTNTP